MSRLLRAVLFTATLLAPVAAQVALTNEDLVKLSKAGLGEEFILNLIQQQPSRLATEAGRLVELKQAGVSERIVAAVVKKTPPREPLTSDGVVQLVKAGYSEGFVLDLIGQTQARFAMDATRIVQLKQAGLSERILSAMVASTGGPREIPAKTVITVRLIDSIDSEKAWEGDEFRASLDEPIEVGGQIVAPKGADAVVKLVAEKESGKLTGKTELTVALASVSIGGKKVPVNTTSVSQASASRGERTAKTAAVTGAVGAVIGAIAGGGRGAAIGAGAGAAAGAGAQVFMKGQRVQIPSETLLDFTTQAPVKLP